jgi:hypothetical protein
MARLRRRSSRLRDSQLMYMWQPCYVSPSTDAGDLASTYYAIACLGHTDPCVRTDSSQERTTDTECLLLLSKGKVPIVATRGTEK